MNFDETQLGEEGCTVRKTTFYGVRRIKPTSNKIEDISNEKKNEPTVSVFLEASEATRNVIVGGAITPGRGGVRVM